MKLISTLLLFISLFISFTDYAFAVKPVKVGYSRDFGLVGNNNSFNQGFGYEVFSFLEEGSNIKFQFIPINFNEIDQKFNAGEIDIFLGHPMYPNFLPQYEFGLPLLPVHPIIATKNKNIFYSDVQELKGKSIAITESDPNLFALVDYLMENEIEAEYIFVKDYQEQMNIVSDFYLITTISEYTSHKPFAILSPVNYSFIAKKGNVELINRLNTKLVEYSNSDPAFLARLYEKYFDQRHSYRPSLTKEQTELLKGQVFNVGFISNHQPYQFVDNKGKPAGLCINILNYLAKRYGFEVKYFPYSTHSSSKDLEHIDFLISSLGEYEEVRKNFEFSKAYFNSSMVLLFANQDKDNPIGPKTIGVLDYLGLDFEKLQKAYPESQLVNFKSSENLLRTYKKGAVNSVLITDFGTKHAAMLLGDNTGQFFESSLDYQFKLGLSQELAPKYLQTINLILSDIPNNFAIQLASVDPLDYLPALYYISIILDKYLWQILFCLLGLALFGLHLYSSFQRTKHKNELEFANKDVLTS